MRSVSISTFNVSDLQAGTAEHLWIEAGQLLTGPLRLPCLTAVGTKPGTTLLAVAGVHGDEYEGMAALRRIVRMLDPSRMCGRVIAIPVANPLAYEARSRIAPLHQDGLNLARVFPGDPEGSPSRQLAAVLLDLVIRNLGPEDVFVDFHSGSADVAFARLIGFRDVPGAATLRAEELARHTGMPNLWRIPDSSGPFNAETARRGIVTLGTETTGRAGCDPDDVAVFEQALRGVLAVTGICPDWDPPARNNAVPRVTIDIPAPATGFFEHAIELDSRVEAGQHLGFIVDLFGETIVEVTAPAAGAIWAARSMPAVRTGELLFYIAVD